MPRPKDPNKKVQMSIRIEPELRDRVQQVTDSDERFRSQSDLVGRAVAAYLDWIDKQAAA